MSMQFEAAFEKLLRGMCDAVVYLDGDFAIKRRRAANKGTLTLTATPQSENDAANVEWSPLPIYVPFLIRALSLGLVSLCLPLRKCPELNALLLQDSLTGGPENFLDLIISICISMITISVTSMIVSSIIIRPRQLPRPAQCRRQEQLAHLHPTRSCGRCGRRGGSRLQQPKTYPCPPVPAARFLFTSPLVFSVFSPLGKS